MPLNGAPAVNKVDQALTANTNSIYTILMGDINTCLEEPHDEREEDLVTYLADHGL